LTKKIFEICKWIWDNEKLPQIWAQSILVTIPKKEISSIVLIIGQSR